MGLCHARPALCWAGLCWAVSGVKVLVSVCHVSSTYGSMSYVSQHTLIHVLMVWYQLTWLSSYWLVDAWPFILQHSSGTNPFTFHVHQAGVGLGCRWYDEAFTCSESSVRHDSSSSASKIRTILQPIIIYPANTFCSENHVFLRAWLSWGYFAWTFQQLSGNGVE